LLGNTRLTVSRLAFGTSRIHHLRDRSARERLIKTAVDAGFTLFDTAPYYGYGVGEATLGRAIHKVPNLAVCTKVGLYPPGGADQSMPLIVARKIAGRVVRRFSRPIVDFSVTKAGESLRGSLRRLKRDRVDLLLLHQPTLELLQTDEWRRWFEADRDLIGTIGLSGEADSVLPFIRARSVFAGVIQTRDSATAREAAPIRLAGVEPQITYGHLANKRHDVDAAEVLRDAARDFPATVLLVSTRAVERVTTLARALDRN
jgi:D-threo-aldose 1-dehydrogenase